MYIIYIDMMIMVIVYVYNFFIVYEVIILFLGNDLVEVY